MPARGQSSLFQDACIPSHVFHVTPFSSGGVKFLSHFKSFSLFPLLHLSDSSWRKFSAFLRAHWLEWAQSDNAWDNAYIYKTLIRSVQSLLSCKVTMHSFLGLGPGRLCGTILPLSKGLVIENIVVRFFFANFYIPIWSLIKIGNFVTLSYLCELHLFKLV